MKPIRLVYAQNNTMAEKRGFTQKIAFAILVHNLAFAKRVVVHWAGNNGVWHELSARFAFMTGRDCEQWIAKTCSHRAMAKDLPGNIRFRLQYLVAGREYWDDNRNHPSLLTADSGVLLGSGFRLAHINHQLLLPREEAVYPVTMAIDWSLQVRRVFVRWTLNAWRTYHQTACFLQGNPGIPGKHETTGCSGGTASSIWFCRLKVRDGGPLEYAIGCETEHGEIWDNNLGSNYRVRHPGLKILTLNLHCWQEDDQDAKFTEIVRAIRENDIDLVCLQEVGEEWNGGKGNWQTNAARIIQERLQAHGCTYSMYTDWSHIGFGRYREGSAILSRHRFLRCDAAYISTGKDIHSIHSRKVVMAQIHFPRIGRINVFCVHLSWWKDGFRQQFEKLHQWASEAESDQVAATFLCGDFNAKAGSQGYMLIADSEEYQDQFLQATAPGVFAKVFRDTVPGREKHLAHDGRIDYIFANTNCRLQPISARILFTGQPYARVSDHPGYLVELAPQQKCDADADAGANCKTSSTEKTSQEYVA